MTRKYLPKTVNVFGAAVNVIESSNLHYGDLKVDGLFDSSSKSIFVEISLPKEEKLQTFIHELGHALLWRVGVGQSNISQELEEMIVENYATMITETFNIRFKKKPPKQ